jgi:tetratricopeptide (TPR) repeat protein
MWNQLGGGAYETLKSVGAADRSYNPAFFRNQAVSVAPRFVDEANFDFHLSASSPLLDAGIAIADAEWGSTVGPPDLGAFGIAATSAASGLADPGMERARANMPHALAMDAALLRAAFDDAGAAAVLARMGTPSAGDLMARYERVRQGSPDPALWDLLAANPERLLEMADRYIQWGLLRDAMVLLTHRYPQPVPALNSALMFYYRSYCRDLLDYSYYAGEDLRVAGTLPIQNVSPRFPGGLQVFQLIVQRNPTDANARFLLALLYQNAGRVSAAREALQNALKLRPGFPDAEGLLAKLGPAPAPARKIRPVGSDPAPGATALAAVPAATSPREIAALALRLAASGDVGGAMSYFTPDRTSVG